MFDVKHIRANYDVIIGDQTTPPVEHFLYQVLNSVTITQNASYRDNQLTLASGHNFQNPSGFVVNYIVIYYIDESLANDNLRYRFLQSDVVDVTGDVITLARPLSFDLNVSKIDYAYRVNVNMALVVGTISNPIKFFTTPVNGERWDLTRLMVDMITPGAPDDSLFGDMPSLTNGIYCGCERDSFTEYNAVFKDNGDFRASAYDVNYASRTLPAGSYGVSVRKTFAGQDKYGVAIRLDGNDNSQFVIYVQDDMTDLERLRVKIMGHRVID